jgi:hypothetical protein
VRQPVIFELQRSRRALKPSPDKLLGNLLGFLAKKDDQNTENRTLSGFTKVSPNIPKRRFLTVFSALSQGKRYSGRHFAVPNLI